MNKKQKKLLCEIKFLDYSLQLPFNLIKKAKKEDAESERLTIDLLIPKPSLNTQNEIMDFFPTNASEDEQTSCIINSLAKGLISIKMAKTLMSLINEKSKIRKRNILLKKAELLEESVQNLRNEMNGDF